VPANDKKSARPASLASTVRMQVACAGRGADPTPGAAKRLPDQQIIAPIM